jgi:hypothetical protein
MAELLLNIVHDTLHFMQDSWIVASIGRQGHWKMCPVFAPDNNCTGPVCSATAQVVMHGVIPPTRKVRTYLSSMTAKACSIA